MPVPINADPFTFGATGQPTLQQLVDYTIEKFYDPEKLKRVQDMNANAAGRAAAAAEGLFVSTAEHIIKTAVIPFARVLLKVLFDGIETLEPALDDIGKMAVDAVLGERPRRGYVPDDIGARLIAKLAPPGGSVEPGIDGAQQYISLIAHMNIEAWLIGLTTELLAESTDALRGAGGAIHSVAELREVITQVMGGGRITRRVLAPFIDAGIVTPAKWHTNKLYHPQLLSVSEAIAAWRRNDITEAERDEEIDRTGLDAHRAAALINASKERLSDSDVEFLWQSGTWNEQGVRDHFTSRGVDDETITLRLLAISGRRIQALDAQVETLAVSAFANRLIEQFDFDSMIASQFRSPDEQKHLRAVAELKRQLNIQRISATQMRAMVKDGIAAVADYRDALAREGYPDQDIVFFELQLRVELQKVKDIEQAKADLAAERAAAKADAVVAKAARDADVAARKARAAFPPLSDYRKGYVHGLIDRDALAAALTRDGIVDDQALYLGDADLDRGAYLTQQDQRAAAIAKAAAGGLSVAQLEQAVLSGVLTVAEFDADLMKRGTADDDRRVLTALLQVQLDNRAAAKKARDDAQQRAALKGGNNADWVRAVRLGVRTMSDYGAFLDAIDTTAVSKSLLLDLLTAELAQDAAARATRAARDQAAADKGIPLARRRSAVIAGVRPTSWYADALVEAGWPIDDQLADLDLLGVEVANADAARAKAAALAAKAPAAVISVQQLSHAFTLGLLTPAEFTTALLERGYSTDDATLIVQLAAASVPNVRAGAQQRTTVVAAAADKGVSLTELEKAVRRGLRTLDDYEADVRGRGYSPDAAALMRQLLEEQVGVDLDGLKTKVSAAIAKTEGAPALDEMIAAVGAGDLTVDELVAALVSLGAPRDAALVLSRLVGSGAAGG